MLNTIRKLSSKLKSCLKEKEALQKRIEEENRKLQEKIRLASFKEPPTT